jgi:hypothetical protein
MSDHEAQGAPTGSIQGPMVFIVQHQIIIKFFNTLKEAFPINPIRLLSAPGTAFKIWKTVQLPLLNNDLLKVYDLSRSLDAKFRGVQNQ